MHLCECVCVHVYVSPDVGRCELTQTEMHMTPREDSSESLTLVAVHSDQWGAQQWVEGRESFIENSGAPKVCFTLTTDSSPFRSQSDPALQGNPPCLSTDTTEIKTPQG